MSEVPEYERVAPSVNIGPLSPTATHVSIDDNNFSARQQPFTMSVWSSNIQPNAEGFSMDYTQVKS